MPLTRMKTNLLQMLHIYQPVEPSKQSAQFAQPIAIKLMLNMVMSIHLSQLFVRLVIMLIVVPFLVFVFSITLLQRLELPKRNSTKEKL